LACKWRRKTGVIGPLPLLYACDIEGAFDHTENALRKPGLLSVERESKRNHRKRDSIWLLFAEDGREKPSEQKLKGVVTHEGQKDETDLSRPIILRRENDGSHRNARCQGFLRSAKEGGDSFVFALRCEGRGKPYASGEKA
tara:strand:- start:45 stop:467 length:423 start_codon:yes stop_codon:yes gene_type:complete